MLSDLVSLFFICITIVYGILIGTAMRNVGVIRTLLEQQNELLRTHTRLLAGAANALIVAGEERSGSAVEQPAQVDPAYRCPKCKSPVDSDVKRCPECGGLFQAGVDAGFTE